MKKILIVEDQRMPRENMERMIAESGRYESAGSISDAGLALARCCRIPVDLILMDVCTAGNRDGIEAAAEIKAKFPNIKIIIVTSMAEVGFLDRAKAAGADSFWYKDISREKLIDIIDRTMAGEKIFPDATPTVRLGLADSTELTAREINVLRLVCDGLEYGEVAEQLNISERTVKYHVSNILSKTGYANKTRLAIAVTNKKFIIPRIRATCNKQSERPKKHREAAFSRMRLFCRSGMPKSCVYGEFDNIPYVFANCTFGQCEAAANNV